jgi:hypothetical protein
VDKVLVLANQVRLALELVDPMVVMADKVLLTSLVHKICVQVFPKDLIIH